MARPAGTVAALAVGWLAVAALVPGLGVWSAVTPVAGAVIAPGTVRAALDRQVVQHETGGVVARILAGDGDRVRAGQPLIVLDSGALAIERDAVDLMLAETAARTARLRSEMAGGDALAFPAELTNAARANPHIAAILEQERILFETRNRALALESRQIGVQIAQARAEIGGIGAQIGALDDQLAVLRPEMARQGTLAKKGLARSATMGDLEVQISALAGQSAALSAKKAALLGRIAELRIAASRNRTMHIEKAGVALAQARRTGRELTARRAALDQRIARQTIRAPIAGEVLASRIHSTGAVVRPAEEIARIVPGGQDLVIAARIRPADIDRVHPGQEARISLPAMSGAGPVAVAGEVTAVAADAERDEVDGYLYYAVEIRPLSQDGGEDAAGLLRPGMPVEAHLRTAKRTVLALIADPLTRYLRRSLRG